ncbi:MAG: hypothetical protein FWC27_02475 [Firmicutes bacterium]|nr:hypothetical protein [Bacillota bacterium]
MADGLLYTRDFAVSEHLTVHVPTLREVLGCYEEYYSAISAVISTPSDLMVQLEDMGIDFMKMDDFTLFCIVFYDLQERQRERPDVFHLIFGEFDLSKLTPVRLEDGSTVIQNAAGSIRIDSAAHEKLCTFLRAVLCVEKNVRNPANEEARRFMIKMERRKQRRAERERKDSALVLSPLESLIVSAVNTAEFPYTYETVLDLTIYQFNASIRQINNKIRFDNLMIGCYAGTVKAKELSNQEMSWMVPPQ